MLPPPAPQVAYLYEFIFSECIGVVSLNSFNNLIFVLGTHCVLCDVRMIFLRKNVMIHIARILKAERDVHGYVVTNV